MHIYLHDYAGHPFQVELSRSLVRRGHRVTHAYFAGDKGPKGDFVVGSDEVGKLEFSAIGISGSYDKGSYVSRRFKDIEYGRNVAADIVRKKPDLVISGNTPTETQSKILNAARAIRVPFVYWVQDFYSIAASRLLTQKLGAAGSLIGGYYRYLEHRQFLKSAGIVLISDDFLPQARKWAGDPSKLHIIENWGALDKIHPQDKDNAWARAHELTDAFVFLYTGTLALKHNPDFLVQLARKWRGTPDVRVVVVGQGVGVAYLTERKQADGLDNLILLPLQPFSQLEYVLASADVLVSVLEKDAGAFSVPSKVQSYLCAQRPILLAAPQENLAARLLRKYRAGRTMASDDLDAFLAASRIYHDDLTARQEAGGNGRRYAEDAYDIEKVTDKFEAVFAQARQTAGIS